MLFTFRNTIANMPVKWQFSLGYLFTLMTAVALTAAIPLSARGNPGPLVMVHILAWLAAVGGTIGGAYGNVSKGAMAGTVIWLLLLAGILALA